MENTSMLPVGRSVIVIAEPHPLSMETVRTEIEPGSTVLEIVGERALSCRVEIGGVQIPEYMWGNVRVKTGTVVHVTRFPQGGGSGGWKNIFRLMAFAALAVLTYGIGSLGMLGAIGIHVGAAATAAIAAAVGIGGSLLITALCPPASSGVGQTTQPTQLKGLTGIQNAADPYGAVTCVLGTMKIFPKLAAQSITELSGDNQYLRCLFDLGYYVNSLLTSDLKIGTDPLGNFSDVEYDIGTSPELFSQEIHELGVGAELDTDGMVSVHASESNADELAVDLIFPAGLFAVDSSGKPIQATCSLRIEYADKTTYPPGSTGAITRIPLLNGGLYHRSVSGTVIIEGDGVGAQASATTESLGFDAEGMQLWSFASVQVTNGGHDYSTATARVVVSDPQPEDSDPSLGPPEIDMSGGTWQNATAAAGLSISNSSAAIDGNNIVIRSAAQQSLRIGLRWKVAKGQYNVKVYRVSTDYQSAPAANQSGDLAWTVLRTIRYSLPSTTPTTKLAMRIKATDQLNGAINTLNLVVSQVIPVWNGSAWVNQASSNPAFIMRWVLRDCPANPRRVPPSRIDDAGLIEWASECAAKGYSFNYTNDQITTVFELLKIICACGRASFTVVNGKYSVVRDVAQTVPVQIFSPRNTSNFQGSRAFVDVVHALRVQFINPNADYQQDEIVVYDDHYDVSNATKFEQLRIPGCTDATMAWKLGRYHMSVARLRANTYSWDADVEHLICNRGDMILFAHDVIGVGLGWGRVKSITMDGNGNVTKLTVDEPQNVTDGTKTYALRFRTNNGTVKLVTVTFVLGTMVREFTLTTPTPGINPGDLFLFGELAADSVPMLVNRIEPTADLAARITAVDAAPEVLSADAGYIDSSGTYHAGIPSITSSITGESSAPIVPPPIIITARSGQRLSGVNDDGVSSPVVIVTGTPVSYVRSALLGMDFRYRLSNSDGAWRVISTNPGESSVTISGVSRGQSLIIEGRSVAVDGSTSVWSQAVHKVADADAVTGNDDYLTSTEKVSLISQYATELATKTAIDAKAASLSVSSVAYDNVVAAISTILVSAGAPANWATIWPDGTTFGPVVGIKTALSNAWAAVNSQRTYLQGAISAAQASNAQAAAIAAAATDATTKMNTAQTNAQTYANTAQAAAVAAAAATAMQKTDWLTGGNIDGSKVDGMAASKITGTITDAQIAGLAASKVTGQLTDSQIAAIAAAKLTGQITQTQITDNSISTAKLAAGAVTAGKIAADTITANEIAANAITATELSTGAVTAGKVAAGAIQAGNIAAGAVVAGSVAAGAILTANLTVANFDNLIPNPNSEATPPAGGWPSGAWEAVGVIPSAFTRSGSHCRYYAQGASSDAGGLYLTPKIPCGEGDQFYFEYWVWNQTVGSATIYAYILFFDVSGSLTGSGSTLHTCTDGMYTKASTTGVAPAGTSFVQFHINAPIGQGSFLIDDMYARRMNDANLIVDGAITTNKLDAGSVTASKISAGAITTPAIAAGAITASKLTLTDTSNLCGNPSGANGTDNWFPDSGNTLVSVFANGSYGTRVGDYCLVLTSATWVAAGYGKPLAVNPDQAFAFSCDVAPGAYYSGLGASVPQADLIVMMLWYSDNGVTQLSWGGAATASKTQAGWATITGQCTAPSGARAAKIVVLSQAGGSWAFKNLVVRKAASAELLVDGAITASKISAGAITGDMITTGVLTADIIYFSDGFCLNTLEPKEAGANVTSAHALISYAAVSAAVASTGYTPVGTLIAVPGFGWTVQAASTSDVYTVQGLMGWLQGAIDTWYNLQIVVTVDGVEIGKTIAPSPAQSNTSPVSFLASFSGLSAGTHTIQISLQVTQIVTLGVSYSNTYTCTGKAVCQRIF